MNGMSGKATGFLIFLMSAGFLGAWACCPPPLLAQDAPDVIKQASTLWQQMRRADVDSIDFVRASDALEQLISTIPAEKRVAVATALMQRGADDAINAAALEMFGQAGLPAADVKVIVENEKRTWPQRVLVRTYYKFCRPEYETRLSEDARHELLKILAARLKGLAGKDKISYGEQRLLSHMLQSVLSRYAWRQESMPAVAELVGAMKAYAAGERTDDVLGESITGWLQMKPSPEIGTKEQAIAAMGHWEPLVRMKTAAWLGSLIRRDVLVGEPVLQQLSDPRDEVRAAAANVFSFALTYEAKKIIPRMVGLLVSDRSVIVQRAAANTLIAHSNEAQFTSELLLKVMETKKPRPGPKRTASILQTLGYLVNPNTPPSQKRRLLDVAVANLAFAPAGALRALEALGPDAKPAVANIIKYRDTQADRFTRQNIDRHVLQAIEPKETK